MTFEQLTYFLAAAETLNFSKAAEKLFVHNTTICRSISNLESEFGGELFIRDKNTLILTELGAVLQREGSLLARHYDDVMDSIRSEVKSITGRLGIVGPSAYTGLLDGTYRRFKELYPNIAYSVQDCNSGAFDAPYFAVRDGKADLGITYSTYLPSELPDIAARKLSGERLDLLIPESHALFGIPEVDVRSIRDSTILVAGFMGETFVNAVRAAVGSDSGNTVVTAELPNDNPILLASAGFGLSFIPHTLARIGEVLNVLNPSASKPSYAAIRDLDTSFDVVLIWRKKYTNPAVRFFLSLLPETV